MYCNVCKYYQSFVGHDFKGWSQVCIFILSPYLSEGDKKVVLAYLKVLKCIVVICGYVMLYIITDISDLLLYLFQTFTGRGVERVM